MSYLMSLTEDQVSIFKAHGHAVFWNGVEYFNFPYWIKSVGDGCYQFMEFDDLPSDIQKFLNENKIKDN